MLRLNAGVFPRGGSAARDSRGIAFSGVMALLFAVTAAATVVWTLSMSAMGDIPMSGGWMLSMAWVPMCGQTWPGVAASFLGMWIVMMAAMMLPSLAPMLWRYRQSIGGTGARMGVLDRLTALAAAGYFCVWTLVGAAVFSLGSVLAEAAMQWPALARAVPVAGGAVVVTAAALQFSAWKARHLACCRTSPEHGRPLSTMAAAWRHGLRLGLHCSCSCAGLTAVLLVFGVMDLAAMAVVTAAITAERLAPSGVRVARVTGIVGIGVGLVLILRATGLW